MASQRTLAALALLAGCCTSGRAATVFVSEPTAIRNGWSTFPVLTRGETIPLLGGTAGQTFAWGGAQSLWDGLGAHLVDADTIQVYVDHETNPGSISRLQLDRDQLRHWITDRVVGNTTTNQSPRPAGLLVGMAQAWTTAAGDATLARPCSGNLWEPHAFGYERGFRDRLFLAGEETFDASGHFQVIDPATNTLYEAVDVGGGGSWESATLIDTGRTDTIALLLGEDQGESPLGTARLSLYVGRKQTTGSFLERNGLVGGTTYFWDADGTDTTVGTLYGPLFLGGNDARATGTWTTNPAEAVLFSKAEDVHVDERPASPGFGTRAALASQGDGVFLIDFSQVEFVAGDLGAARQSEVAVLYAAGTDLGDGSGATGLFTAMDNLVWSADGTLYVNEDDGEGDIWQIRVEELLAAYAGGDRTPDADVVFQVLDADAIAGLGITESSGIIDISALVGYVPGSVLLTNGMGSVADQLAMLVSPSAAPLPAVVTVDVASGSTTQRQAGLPMLSGTTPVAKTGSGTLVLDQVNLLTGSVAIHVGVLAIAHADAAGSATIAPLPGGTLAIATSAASIAGLDLQAGGRVDVGDALVTVTGGLAAVDLEAAIRVGRGDGSWNATSGIVSAAIGSSPLRAVGWFDRGDGSVTFGYAAPGDTNLDRSLDLLDMAEIVAAGRYDTGEAATWAQGDFTYDGLVDILDIAAVFGTDLLDEGPYAGVAAPAVAPVPEPMAGGGLAVSLTVAAVSARRSVRRRRTAAVRHPASTGRPVRSPRAPASR